MTSDLNNKCTGRRGQLEKKCKDNTLPMGKKMNTIHNNAEWEKPEHLVLVGRYNCIVVLRGTIFMRYRNTRSSTERPAYTWYRYTCTGMVQ